MKTIRDVVRKLREADPPLKYLGKDDDVAFGKFLEFELVQWNGKPRIVPSEALNLPGRLGDRSFLYRGQVIHYPTCGPSLLRGVPNDERQVKARLSLERFRVAELELVLRDHPFRAVAETYGFSVDYHGLAQHYGIPTSLLDLTSNVEVAAFFAAAQWDREAQVFAPMESGVGVLYRFDWSAFGPGYSKFFEPVGFGPGLRPARQHAWTFRLRPGVDFQSVPHVTAIEFAHSKSASRELFDQFANGSWLYPPDCLATLVEKLRDLQFVTMHAIRHAVREDGQPADRVEVAAERAAQFINATLGLEVVDGYELRPEEADLAIAKQQASILDEAIRGMRKGVRLVRTRRPPSVH
jgi:FRG domain